MLQSKQRPSGLRILMQLQLQFQLQMLTVSSTRARPAVVRVSFDEPSLMKCVDVFSTRQLEAQAISSLLMGSSSPLLSPLHYS